MRAVLMLFAVAACAPSLNPELGPDAAPSVDGAYPSGPVGTIANSDGTFSTRIEATAEDQVTLVDLDGDGIVGSGDAWDLQVRRFHFGLNGGVTGSAGGEVVPVAAETIHEVTTVPTSGWITDEPDGDDPNEEPDFAFEQGDTWYDYNSGTHVLSPRPLVWVVRTRSGGTIALDILSYYDSVGTAGIFTVHWKHLGD